MIQIKGECHNKLKAYFLKKVKITAVVPSVSEQILTCIDIYSISLSLVVLN